MKKQKLHFGNRTVMVEVTDKGFNILPNDGMSPHEVIRLIEEINGEKKKDWVNLYTRTDPACLGYGQVCIWTEYVEAAYLDEERTERDFSKPSKKYAVTDVGGYEVGDLLTDIDIFDYNLDREKLKQYLIKLISYVESHYNNFEYSEYERLLQNKITVYMK